MHEGSTKKWLLWGVGFVEVFGVLLVAAALLPGGLDPMVRLLFASATRGAPDLYARLASAVAGAVLAGWAATVWFLVRRFERLSPQVVSRAFATGIVVWFLLDGLASMVLGAYLNLVGNSLLFVLLFLPARALAASKSSADSASRDAAPSALA